MCLSKAIIYIHLLSTVFIGLICSEPEIFKNRSLDNSNKRIFAEDEDNETEIILPPSISPDVLFTCPNVGNFLDETSRDCVSYYSCTLEDGLLISTKLDCDPGYFFWSSNGNCVLTTTEDINCDNTVIAPPLTDAPPTTTELPDSSTTFNTNTNSESTYSSPSSSTSDTFSTNPVTVTTTEDGEEEPSFECLSRGRFDDESSTDCATYFFCSLNYEGKLVGIRLTCPQPLLIFSLIENTCVLRRNYECTH